jgi:AcrR family transcriptional regulator
MPEAVATRQPLRRSHAERTAETRTRIIAAVNESIAAVGFQRTTATEIAARAGVTWGAVQHHFGGKDGILLAVLEDSFERFAARLEQIPLEDTSIHERVSSFIDRAWEHFASNHYRSTFEILLNYPPQVAPSDGSPAWQAQMFRAWNRVWHRLFANAPISRAADLDLQRFTIAALSGLAYTRMLQGDSPPPDGVPLGVLKRALVREFSNSAPAARTRRSTGARRR